MYLLGELKEYFESFMPGTEFKYGLSEPFSWRGSYNEVAFALESTPMTREDILDRVNQAYTESFKGYKGGDYSYDDHTTVNFEDDYSSYTDGEYALRCISEIEQSTACSSVEEKLIRLAFDF